MKRALIVLAACAGHAPTPTVPANFAGVPTESSPVVGALYANCLAAATAAQHYGEAHDHDTHVLLFTCGGEPAKAFYDGLAEYTAKIRSEVVRDGRTYRPTQVVKHDLFGVDYCVFDGTTYACTVTVNVGRFLESKPQ
ncbi:MAG TPA: hypothetical protein VGM90_36085 [Kofleriaceae bacterium]